MVEGQDIIVEIEIRGYWNPETKEFCGQITENSDWTWDKLVVDPLTIRYKGGIELESLEQTSNKIKLRVKLKNRTTTPKAVYSIINRHLELNKKTIASSGLTVEREMPEITV